MNVLIDEAALLAEFSAAADAFAILTAIDTHEATLLEGESAAHFRELPDNAGRQQAIGLGLKEIANLFGGFTSVAELKLALEFQITVEYAKHLFIGAVDGAATAEDMAAAIVAHLGTLNDHRQALIAEWGAVVGNEAVAARVAELQADPYTIVLNEIAGRLGETTFTADLGALVLAARNELPDAKFFGVVRIVTALDNASDALNLPPAVEWTAATVEENAAGDAIVIGSLSAADPEGAALTYTLSAASAELFELVEKQGGGYDVVVKAGVTLDYETLAHRPFTVTVSDGTNAVEKIFTLNLTDANDNAPTGITVTGGTVAEAAAVGAEVAALSVQDQDTVGTYTYTIVANELGAEHATENAFFKIEGDKIQVKAALDDAQVGTHELWVKVTDGINVPKTQKITLDVTNVNEAPTNVALSNASVAEMAAAGTVIGLLSASDPDAGEVFTYTLTDDRFAIVNNQLVVKDGAKLDFEQAQSHQIKVKVTDKAGASIEKAFTIAVDDVKIEKPKGSSGDDVLKAGKHNDVLVGGAGNDKFYGGLGKDILTGVTGKDIFVFDTLPDRKTNLDRIVDFNVKDDTIWLDNKVFAKLGKGSELKPGKLNKAFFTVGDKAKDKNDYLVYDADKAVLSYDVDGSGAKAAVEIAILKKGLKLSADDFWVI